MGASWRDPSRVFGAIAALGALMFGAYVIGGAATALFGPKAPGPGEPAPAFEVSTLGGAPARRADYEGQVVLLDFWSTWCVGCIGSTPRLNRLHDDYGPQGFSVVSLNQEPEDLERVARVVRERDIRYPVLIDPGEVADAYGVTSFPTVVLIDRSGTIRSAHRGAVAESRLRREIESALGQ